jgi:hypothetical protein
MADDPTLPFSALNQQPGVSGLQDIDLPIGDILDGIQALKDTVFSLDDLADALNGDVGEAFADATPLDEIASAVAAQFEGDEGPSTGASIDAIGELVAGQTEIVLNRIDSAEDQIIGALSGEIDDISVVVEGVEIDEDEIADEIAEQLDLPGGGGTVINFDSVFGAIASSIEESFEIVLSDLIGTSIAMPQESTTVAQALTRINNNILDLDPDIEIPTVVEFGEAVVDAVVDLPGGELLDAPDSFIDGQIDRVTDGLVDADAVASLEASIQEAA